MSAEVGRVEVERELTPVGPGQCRADRGGVALEHRVLVGHRARTGERVNLEGQSVGVQRRAVHDVEVQVRSGGAAGVAEQSEYLTAVDPVPRLDGDAVSLQVGVEGEVAAAD